MREEQILQDALLRMGMSMRLSLQHNTVTVNGIKLHYVEQGTGPAVVLLHGFPESWYAWRHQIPALAEQFRVIVPDLRGYGASQKPASGYDKKTMARDIRELMVYLGLEKAAIIGHDRGARVGLRFAKDFPEMTSCFAALDNIPTLTIFDRMNAAVARTHWFFLFNAVRDLPEVLINGREEIWLRHIFSSWTHNPETLTEEEITRYVETYRRPGSLRGAFEDYRAGEIDVKQDRADHSERIRMPTLVLWGEDFAAGGRLWDFREVWGEYAEDPHFAPIPQCGHLPHEEHPEVVTAEILRFLGPWKLEGLKAK
jgi:haloacetate dehalogenase